MFPEGHSIVPGVDGGLFTGSRTSAAGLNQPIWAKITGNDGQTPIRYGWKQQTVQALAPGGTLAIGAADMDGGLHGTATLNPVIDLNNSSHNIGDIVRIQRAYFDNGYDWVYTIVSGGGTSTTTSPVAASLTWGRITGPPPAVLHAQPGGNLTAGTYYVLGMIETPQSPEGHFSASAPTAISVGPNQQIKVDAPNPSIGRPPDTLGWRAYLATSADGIFLQASDLTNLATPITITDPGSGPALRAFSYSWKEVLPQVTIRSDNITDNPPYGGTFEDKANGLSGLTWMNPAYEHTLSPWVDTSGNIVAVLRQGIVNGSYVAQEWLFFGGASSTLQVMSTIQCQGSGPVLVRYTADIINGMVKAVF